MRPEQERDTFEAWFEDWRRSTWKPLESDQRREMPEHWNIAYKRHMELAFQAAAALAASQEKAEPVASIGAWSVKPVSFGDIAHILDSAGNHVATVYTGEAKKIAAAHNAAPVAAQAHSDDEAVDRFAAAMKEKLASAREKGRSGWEQMDPAELSLMLREHVEKGDPRDVANFCMFLWALGQPIGASQKSEPICYLWLDLATKRYEVDRCTHPSNELIPVYTAPQPSAEAVRDAAYEAAADVAMKAPITAGMEGNTSAQALAFHASARIRALKSAPPHPAKMTDELRVLINDAIHHCQMSNDMAARFTANRLREYIARAQGEQA